MENEKDQKQQEEFLAAIKSVPPKFYPAILWVMQHYDLAEALCKKSGMTAEEIALQKRKALREDQHLMYILLCFAQTFQQQAMKQNGLQSNPFNERKNESDG